MSESKKPLTPVEQADRISGAIVDMMNSKRTEAGISVMGMFAGQLLALNSWLKMLDEADCVKPAELIALRRAVDACLDQLGQRLLVDSL
jgi:hypothetical protein